MDAARGELETAQREGEFERAGELAYVVIPELERNLAAQADSGEQPLVAEAVSEEHVAAVVARWTGIPAEKLMSGEREKLLELEAHLARRVVGQTAAISAVAHAVRRARAGLQAPNRPIGSFLFLGPTGVGKTELVKALALQLFSDEAAMVRIDMSEYMERHAVARLVGAPPGYVGYEDGGTLTEAVRRRPYQIILFDEIEKAHPDVFNILLQILDDGRLTDSQGRVVDFRNVLIAMTSNLGADILLELPDGGVVDDIRPAIDAALKQAFRPEFLNRIDETLLFQRLARDDIRRIVDIRIADLQRLLERRKITLSLEPEAIDVLASEGYHPAFGARPLNRAIQQRLQNPLSEKLLAGDISDGSIVSVSLADGKLDFAATRADMLH